jgi:hypothetical protein
VLVIKPVGSELDFDNIVKLNNEQKDFSLNTIADSIVDRIVYSGDEVVAYGIVKKMAEAIMLTNPKVPLSLRAKAMRELMIEAEIGSKKFGCNQLHCFVSNRQLADTLIKHFGFIPTQDIVLVKGI